MCAVAGMIGVANREQTTVDKMLSTMRRRGPDESGVYKNNDCCLLHTRLTVIDPSGGKQPMQLYWAGETYTIVYNGELYNTNEMEAGILVDIHTWEHFIIKGTSPRKVELKNNLKAYKKLISGYRNQLMFIHNHPSTGTFSGEDFKMFCLHNSLYMMTVIGNDSSVYILTKTFEFNADKAIADYIHLSMQYYNKGYKNNNGTLAIKEILKNAKQYGLIYKKGRKKI